MKVSLHSFSCVLALLIGTVLASPPAFAAPACKDTDGDGYGRHCPDGDDCDDSDPNVHPGAAEICDGLDNDCDQAIDDGAEAGGYCGTGEPGACAEGMIQCVNATLQCVPLAAPSPEVCDGIDNDCNGQADEGPGPDLDLDGVTATCDCNESDPSVHSLAHDICGDQIDQDCDGNTDDIALDPDGRAYCLSFEPIAAVVNEPSPVTLRAFHEDGINQLRLVQEGDALNAETQNCNGATTCTLVSSVFQQHEGERLLQAFLTKSPNAFAAEVQIAVLVACSEEYCQPDPAIGQFMDWMRGKGYDECIASKYLSWSLHAEENVILKDFLEERPASLAPGHTIEFYDVVPTDPEATYLSLGAGEGGDCQPSTAWPAWCPTPVPADYLFLEQHFERTFGMDLTFNYHRLEIDYSETFGEPVLNAGVYKFGSRTAFTTPLPQHSIVHWAIQSYAGLLVGDMTGAGHLAEVSFEPFNVSGTVTYTHEWGHTWGLPHPFYGQPRSYVALDGVMDNTYRPITGLMDPLDPLERYALEPQPGGYADDATFAGDYGAGLTGDPLLAACRGVDPAVASGRFVETTAEGHVFEVTLSNEGMIPVGYVKLTAEDATQGVDYSERIIHQLTPWGQKTQQLTIPGSGLLSSTVLFTLDRAGEIAEEDEGNNSLAVSRPCDDADADGFAPSCQLCDNPMCPALDCNDGSAGANPGLTEGPFGDPTCQDSLDNDCNGLIDLEDTDACFGPCTDSDGDGYAASCFLCENSMCPVKDCADGNPQVNPGAPEGPVGDPTCQDGLDNDCDGLADDLDFDACSGIFTAAADDQTGPGLIVQGSYLSTRTSDDVRQGLSETLQGGVSRLTHVWRIDNVTPGTSQELIVEGYRTSNGEGDNFQFSYSTNGTAFNPIPGAVIDKIFEQQGGGAHPLGTGSLSGTVYVRVQDTDATAGASSLDTVYVDYVAIRTVP